MAALDMLKSSQISLLDLSPIDAAPKCSQMLGNAETKICGWDVNTKMDVWSYKKGPPKWEWLIRGNLFISGSNTSEKSRNAIWEGLIV